MRKAMVIPSVSSFTARLAGFQATATGYATKSEHTVEMALTISCFDLFDETVNTIAVGVVKPDGTSQGNPNNPGRTSKNTWLDGTWQNDERAKQVWERLVNVTGIPERNSEHLQLLRYEEGQFYTRHHDYIDHHRWQIQSVRILTFFMYFNDVAAGGGTHFPLLNITIVPKRGRSVLWPSVLDDDPNAKDVRTDHEALAVESGVKYGGNAWFHQRDYVTAHEKGCT
jgi:prolyl 4-hydroxylase